MIRPTIPLVTLSAVLALTIGLAYLGCNQTADTRPHPERGAATQPSSTLQPNAVRWGGPKNISMLPLIAEHQHLFKKERLSATFVEIQTGKKALDALRTGDIDLAVIVDMNVALAGFEKAKDIRVLAGIEKKRDDALIVSSPEIREPDDLVGQTIGVTLGTTSHAFLVQFLKANGLKVSSVILQNMPPPAIQAALLNDSLKAGCLWQPFRNSVLTARPDSLKEWNDSRIYTSYVLLACSETFLKSAGAESSKQNPIVSFLKALIGAEHYVGKNPAVARRIIADRLGIPADVMNKIWGEYELKVFLNEELLSLLKGEGDWISELIPEHKDKAAPDYRHFIHEAILRSLDAKRVRNL